MAVTAVTITSGPTVVGRSVTLSGTLDQDGSGSNNNLNFLCYTVGFVTLGTITKLSNGATVYNAAGAAATGVAWTWTGTLPEGDWLAVTVNLSDPPYTTRATSASNVGLIQLRKPLSNIWIPRRDARGLFVERFPKPLSYKNTWNGSVVSQYRRTFHYPTSDGRIYWSAVDNAGREGEYGTLPKPAYTPYGPGIDVPSGWEWSVSRYGGTNTPGGYSTSTIVYVSVFHIHNANVYVDNATMTYPAICGGSRYNRSEVFAYWSNTNGEQSIKFGTGGFQSDSLQNVSIDGVGNGLHCLVILQRNDTSTDGHRVYLDGKLVGSATGLYSYLGAVDLRPYYWGGSISQSHLNIGNILFQGSIDKFYPTDEQAAEISRDPYRLFFRDAPSHETRLFRLFASTAFTTARPNADVTTTGWTAEPPGALYSAVDETTADDSDFIISPDLNSTPGPAVLGLDQSAPAGSYTVRFRARRTATVGQVRVALLDSSNTVQGTSGWVTVGNGFAQYTANITTSGTATRVRIEVQP
jgi:hypothetical protein